MVKVHLLYLLWYLEKCGLIKLDLPKTIFILSFTLILLSGCATMKYTKLNPESAPGPIRLLSLGDSYTIGTSVLTDQRFPTQMANQLRNQGFEVEDPTIIAQNGWTTGELLDGIRSSEIDGAFDFVTLVIGVNNQFRGDVINVYRDEFREILHFAIDYSEDRPERVFVLSIPDWGAAPYANGMDRDQISTEIDLFNKINREETEAAGARYVDVTPLSREVLNDTTLLAQDGLHLSGKMYKMWAQLVIKEVLPILTENSPEK